MKIRFKYKYEVIIFITEAVFMTLELVASRILSPYFGNTNIVWTSVIGIILLSSSLGNFIGGIIADKKESEKSLKLILMVSSLFVLIIPFTSEHLLSIYPYQVNDIKIGAIVSTISLFFIPSLLLGLINPIILKRKIKDITNVGKTSGKIYSILTLGGIFGTFISGFYLIPNFGSNGILFVLSIILLILSLFFHIKYNKINIIFIIMVIIIEFLLFINYYKNNINDLNKILNGEFNIKASIDTEYNKILIYNTYTDDKIRILNVSSGFESATYLDKDKRNELVWAYTKYYDLMFKSDKNINNVLMIGGGGYSYPKYYISHYKDKYMDVVEIDEEVTRLAKKYFYLEETIKKYKASDRLKLINEDGRTYLNRNSKKYDAILNDSFNGLIPPKTLTTKEAITRIKESLNENGLYLTNIVSSSEGKNSRFLKAEVKTLKEIFKNVYIVPCHKMAETEVQNYMVIATDNKIEYKNTKNIIIEESNIILTDDYAPVESLIPINN